MGKEELLADLNRKKEQLREAKKRLQNLEDQYEALEEFTAQCNSRIQAFDDSMLRRKNKLLRLDGILNKAKSAKRYRDRMNELLVGTDFKNASSSISNLETSTSNKKRSIRNDITNTEAEIDHLKQVVENLQYSYDTYPEEVKENA